MSLRASIEGQKEPELQESKPFCLLFGFGKSGNSKIGYIHDENHTFSVAHFSNLHLNENDVSPGT